MTALKDENNEREKKEIRDKMRARERKKIEIENYTNNLLKRNGNAGMKCGLSDMRHVLLMFAARAREREDRVCV